MRQFVMMAAGAVVMAAGFAAVPSGSAEAQVQARGAPRGDYTRTCTGSYVNQGRLYADCRDNRNNVRETSIELARCSSDEIRNDNGLLVCGRHRGDYERPGGGNGGNPGWPGGPGGGNGNNPGWPGGPGGGWGNSSITVYRDADFRGQSLTFRQEVSNLRNTGMNDSISSMRLGRGSWEVCTDAYFRGDCQIINNDTRNLRDLNLNDKISSLRPARRGDRW